MRLLLAASLIAFALPVHAQVYPSCASPAAPAHTWYIDPVNGSTPDAAHGGLAVSGVMGTADGSQAHPFNSLNGVFHGGKNESPVIPGYEYPALSTAPYDHGGITVYGKLGVGVRGLRRDYDYNPASPDPTRINPGDEIVLAPGNYGDLYIGYYAIGTYNVDASGNTSFVTITGAPNLGSTFTTISVVGARGFALSGLEATSIVGVGRSTPALLTITGSKLTPTQDIIFDNGTLSSFSGWSDVAAQYAASGTTYATEQAFLAAKLKPGAHIAGDDIPGVDNHCVAVTNTQLSFVAGGLGPVDTSDLLVQDNGFYHFADDGTDIETSNMSIIGNIYMDPINIANGTHPDGMQVQTGAAGNTGPYSNIMIDHNTMYERLEATNPYPQSITFLNLGFLNNATVTNNVGEVSNCLGLTLGSSTHNSLIANNTIIGSPVGGCPALPSGESAGSDNNTWINNVTAGRFYQACNHSVWQNNVQIPVRSGGVSTPATLGYCNTTTNTATFVTLVPGVYNGVSLYTTNSPTFAFTHYDPPANFLITPTDPDLTPTPGGPLYQTGKSTTEPNVGAY